MTFDHTVAHTSERDRAIATIVAAFVADPVTRWVFPNAAQYLEAFPRVVQALGGRAFEMGTAFSTADHAGLALWLGPGIERDDEELGAVVDETVDPELMEDLQGFGQRQAELHPHEPHWYLPLIGVDPAHQGKGIGSALLSRALEVVDQDGLPAYLEATTLDSRRLYERHGFVLVGEIQYGSSPSMYAMRREPRSQPSRRGVVP